MKVMRKMRKLDDLYDSDFEGGTDSTPVHSPTPKSSKLVIEQRGLLKKRKRKPIDSDSDSDIDAPEGNTGDFFPHRLVQPESSTSLTLDVSQSKVVSAGADVIKFSLASSLSDSPNDLGTTPLVAVPLLNSSHSIASALKAAKSSESSSSFQNINESPLIHQDNSSDKSIAADPILKPVRGKSKMCLGDLLDKRPYQKSPIVSKLSSSNSPGVKTPIIASSSSSSSSSLIENNPNDSGAKGPYCVRLEADNDDWMEDFIPVKNSETPTPKKRKNAKDDQITKSKENKSRKKDNDDVDKSVDMKEKKKKTMKEKEKEEDKKGKKIEKNGEDVSNEKIEGDAVKKEGEGLSTVKDRLIAAALLSARGDVNEMISRPLLLPLMPLDTDRPVPTLPVLPATTATTTTATATADADADAPDGTLPTTSTVVAAASAQSLGGIATSTSTSTSNPSKRNLPKSLVVKHILSGGRKLNMSSELLCELDATSSKGNPVIDKVVDLSMLRNSVKASGTFENVSDVTAVCNPADKTTDTEGESEQRLKEGYFRL
jgi:hypothetical protein